MLQKSSHTDDMFSVLKYVFTPFARNTLAKMHYSSGVSIRLLPSYKCSFEDPVHVTVSGLNHQQCVDLRSKITDDSGRVFQAWATYQADDNGQVDLNRDPSLGGSFTGVEPMGLFWALKAEVVSCKFALTDVTRPALVDIEVVSDNRVIAKVTNERHCLTDGVRRIPVTEGRIRGTLFMPPGKGPFPGILDTYVFRGGPFELRAALLAKRGFAVFALAFQGYQDLPKRADKFHLEYFEEGIDFLRQQPEVKDQKIGLVSISKSGDLGLSMATFLPGISATVWINGCNANTLVPIYYKDICVPPLMFDVKRAKMTPLGLVDIGDVMNDPMSEEGLPSIIPIERASGNFMFIMSEADRNWQSAYYAKLACNRLKAHGKNNYELVRYEKAGHFIEVPYMPFCLANFHAVANQVVYFGGEPKAHSEAQLDTWKRMVNFFKKHLAAAADNCKSRL
uniref:Acyl-coenzyme A thioesterase 1-like n=2 Tax=Sinocyclocheilus anshuiensis TaxID=1608454 RepID=A0A671PKK6_9TELE